MLRSIRPRIAGRREARRETTREIEWRDEKWVLGCSGARVGYQHFVRGRSKRVGRGDSGERRQAGENRATGDIEIGLGRVPLVMWLLTRFTSSRPGPDYLPTRSFHYPILSSILFRFAAPCSFLSPSLSLSPPPPFSSLLHSSFSA